MGTCSAVAQAQDDDNAGWFDDEPDAQVPEPSVENSATPKLYAAPFPSTDNVWSNTSTADVRKSYRWYGWQIVLLDAATIMLTSFTKEHEVFFVGYLAGPILAHGFSGHWERASRSAGLRLALPLVGGYTMAHRGIGGAIVGGIMGSGLAVLTDYIWSYDALKEHPGALTLGQCEGLSQCTTVGYAMSW